MGECLIIRRGREGGSYKLPVLNSSYPKDVSKTVASSSVSATFNVEFSTHGNPAEYTYQWYVNGSAVSGATSSSYTKTGLNSTATYTVYCKVTNKAGTVTSRTATLKVTKNTTPVLNSSYPADVSMVERANGSATFKVEIATAGVPASYTYQWYVDNSAVSGATSSTYTKTGLTSVASHTVYCKVSNSAGTVTSRVANLNVLSSKPVYTYTGEDELINEYTYSWKLKLKTGGTLTFSHLGNGASGMEVFCVGAGGGCPAYEADGVTQNNHCGGGAGGYATTNSTTSVKVGTPYIITIGAGTTGKGGTTSALGFSAEGGNAALESVGASGGTGGGGYGGDYGGAGGENGGNGSPGYYNGALQSQGGSGDGKSKYEFGGTSGTLYCGGGGGSSLTGISDSGTKAAAGGAGGGGAGGVQSHSEPTSGGVNTGGGGGGRYVKGSSTGGSGIVIIRNSRS